MRNLNQFLAGKTAISVVLLIVGLALMVSCAWLGWISFAVGLIIFLVVLLLNALVQVEAEEAGIQKIFGSASRRVLYPGLNLVWPFITKMIMVNTKKNSYPHVEEGIDPADGFKLGVSYVVLAKLNPRYVWRFATGYNLPLDTNYTIDFMQKILRDVCVKYTCDQLRTDASSRTAVQDEVHAKFMAMVDEKLDLSLFDEIDVIVKDYVYLPEYLALVERVKKAEKEAEAAEAEKKAVETLADAKAAKIKKEGDATNAVMLQMAQILREHPELNEKTFYEHYPQFIGGGVLPTFNVGGVPGTPTPTPAPTTPAPTAP